MVTIWLFPANPVPPKASSRGPTRRTYATVIPQCDIYAIFIRIILTLQVRQRVFSCVRSSIACGCGIMLRSSGSITSSPTLEQCSVGSNAGGGVSPPSSIPPWMSPHSRTRICHSLKMYWGNLYPEAITSVWGSSSVTSGWISRYKPAPQLDGTSLFPETARSGKTGEDGWSDDSFCGTRAQ